MKEDLIQRDTAYASAPKSQASAEQASPKMDPTLKAEWISALRSGEYKQSRLCLRNGAAEGFCCLGVLAAIQGAEWDNDRPIVNGHTISHDEGGWIREDFAGGLPLKLQQQLSNMNDNDRASFASIADYIEANL